MHVLASTAATDRIRRAGDRRPPYAAVVAAVVLACTAWATWSPQAGATTTGAAPVVSTYAPAGFVDSVQSPAQVDTELGEFAGFGIDRVLQQLVPLGSTGGLKLSATTSAMLPLWVERTTAYDASTGSSLTVAAVLNGRTAKGLDVDDAATRAAVVADAVHLASLGVGGIQLDFEPFPTTSGYPELLGQIHAALAASFPGVQLSVVAPAETATWSPAYLAAVSGAVDEVDPTFYDSGLHSVTAYEQWIATGLAYYAAATAPTARIVPVIPSFRSDPWHRPAVENVTTATAALAGALGAGDRVDGVGLWWWWGFYFGSGGHYAPAADQAAWQSSTRPLLGF